MYLPAHFAETRTEVLHAAMRSHPLGTLITLDDDGALQADPIPLLVEPGPADHGTLRGHVARANPLWRRTRTETEVLVVFQGAQSYVSPGWYPSKAEHGKVVPTWNYVAVHAYGPVEFFEDADRILGVVTRLTNLHERPRAEPWAVTDAPEAFVRAQLRAIVGLRMPITRMEGKRKMSQNRSAADRAGVAAGLAASERASDRAVAALIPA